MNQVVIVGRLVDNPEIKELESGKKTCNITLAVSRSYKNAEGVYETDFISCVLWEGIAQNTCEYCHKGDVLGVKGRLQTDTIETNGEKKYVMRVIAERVTFLSSKKNEE